MVEDKKIQDAFNAAAEVGISGRTAVRVSIGVGTVLALVWYSFLVFLAVSVGWIPTVVMGTYITLRLLRLVRSAAAIEEQMDKLEAAEAK
jgi:MFS superfamily sulfate permease-like transporter